MKVALIQLAYGDDESVADRTTRVTDLVRAQAGHDLVVLPGAVVGGRLRLHGVGRAGGGRRRTRRAGAGPRRAGRRRHPARRFDRRAGRPRSRPTAKACGTRASSSRPRASSSRPTARSTGSASARASPASWTPVRTSSSSTCPSRPAARCPSACRPATTCASPSSTVACSTGAPRSSSSRLRGPRRRVAHWTLLGQARAVEDQCVVLQCNTAGTHAAPRDGWSLPGRRRHREGSGRRGP